MNFPETHYHLDHLPAIDQYFINEAENLIYQWPSIDYDCTKELTSADSLGRIKNHGFPVPTPACVQHGQAIDGHRHAMASRTVQGINASSFIKTKFAQDLTRNLGTIKCRYMYNRPWTMYDWHQDLAGHESSINFLLTDTPEARTLHRFPSDCRLNYHIELLNYKLYRPVLFNAKIDHCIINTTNKDRYILSVLMLDSSYETAKEYLNSYVMSGNSYL